jgi:hypothetical protein
VTPIKAVVTRGKAPVVLDLDDGCCIFQPNYPVAYIRETKKPSLRLNPLLL